MVMMITFGSEGRAEASKEGNVEGKGMMEDRMAR